MKTNPETLKRFCKWWLKNVDQQWIRDVKFDYHTKAHASEIVLAYINGWNNPNHYIWAGLRGAIQPTYQVEMVDVSDVLELVNNLYKSFETHCNINEIQ